MNKMGLAQKAYDFLNSFKAEILQQLNDVNAMADGELQDGYSSIYIDDGWVTLKGCSWGFVVHYDEPVRMDMTFGPDQPFVGHRITFLATDLGNNIAWINQERPNEIYYGTEQLSRYGLRRLASKVGDEWIFDVLLPGEKQQQLYAG